MSKVIALHQSNSECPECLSCRALSFQYERSIKLHTQTTTALAGTEGLLVEARRENRYLKSKLASAIASIKYLGGDASELIEALNLESWQQLP